MFINIHKAFKAGQLEEASKRSRKYNSEVVRQALSRQLFNETFKELRNELLP